MWLGVLANIVYLAVFPLFLGALGIRSFYNAFSSPRMWPTIKAEKKRAQHLIWGPMPSYVTNLLPYSVKGF